MQKARSGLAAAAARLQLVDAPEGKSSLQSQLYEAERRAQDAEASAQDAQAALARTLLDAARVEAVVTARIKAKSEAEIEALRSELDAMKQAASTLETALHGDPCEDADRTAAALETELEPATELELEPATSAVPESVVPDSGDHGTEARDGVAASDDAAGEDAVPKLHISDEDRPEWARPPEDPVMESNLLRFLPPARAAFLAVVAIVAVVSYYVTTSIMDSRDGRMAVAGSAEPYAAEGVLRDTGTDAQSIAKASASLDAELARLQALSQKVAALRTALAVRRNATPTRMAAADRAPSGSGASWLLYMPVERPALVQYLAGRSWPGIQMAAQPGEPPALER
jgi:hypothetical protein